jgi:MFS family permease
MTQLQWLAVLIFFNQGIGDLPTQSLYYFLRENLHISVGTIMTLTAITNLPWMIKPIYGFISDSFPIFGYKRKPYIFISGLICTTMALAIAFLPFYSVPLLIALMLCYQVGTAGDSVAVNGIVVEEGNKDGTTGNLQSVEWTSLGLAQVLVGVVGGYIAEKTSYHIAFLVLAVFPILIMLLAHRYKEHKSPAQHNTKTIVKDFIHKLKSKQMLMVSLFLFFLWFSPSFGTPLMEKMRVDLHMSKTAIGWIGTLNAIGAVLGALLYLKINRKINMKRWLYYGTIISAISTFAYLYLTIPSLWIYTIVFGLTGQFINLLMLNLMALTCPKGTEATTYALLCSLVNTSAFFSSTVGGLCYDHFGYNGLIIISGITTLCCLGFIPFLNFRQNRITNEMDLPPV